MQYRQRNDKFQNPTRIFKGMVGIQILLHLPYRRMKGFIRQLAPLLPAHVIENQKLIHTCFSQYEKSFEYSANIQFIR